MLFSIYLEPNVALALVKEEDLREVVQLVEKDCIAWLVARLQIP